MASWKTYVKVLGEVVVATRVQDTLQDVSAPAEEGRDGATDGNDPADKATKESLACGQLWTIETVADNVVPVEGDKAQQPDAANTGDSSCEERERKNAGENE